MVALDWVVVTPAPPRVKGHETAYAYVPGSHCRFAIYEVWAWNGEYLYTRYRVRDAATVSDAQLREGKRSAVVWEGDDWAEALEFCAKAA